MVLDIAVSLIAFALILGVFVGAFFLIQMKESVKSLKKDLHQVTTRAVELIGKSEELVSDLQSKTESLDILFKPLKAIHKSKSRSNAVDTISEVVEWVGTSFSLLNRIRNVVKRHEK